MANIQINKQTKNYKNFKIGPIGIIWGHLEPSQYENGDTLEFVQVNSKNLVVGQLTVETSTPAEYRIMPGQNLSSAVNVAEANGGTKVPLRYVFVTFSYFGSGLANNLAFVVNLGS